MRIQKLLRSKFESFNSGAPKTGTDPKKTAEDLKQKQQAMFIQWTNELNQKAALRDYLALPEEKEETKAPKKKPEAAKSKPKTKAKT